MKSYKNSEKNWYLVSRKSGIMYRILYKDEEVTKVFNHVMGKQQNIYLGTDLDKYYILVQKPLKEILEKL